MPPYSPRRWRRTAVLQRGIGTKDVPEDKVDIGRMKVTNDPADWAAFNRPACATSARARRTPRRLGRQARGRRQVMASGGIPNKNKPPAWPTSADRGELAELIAFLGALDCGGELRSPPPIGGTRRRPTRPRAGRQGRQVTTGTIPLRAHARGLTRGELEHAGVVRVVHEVADRIRAGGSPGARIAATGTERGALLRRRVETYRCFLAAALERVI